MAPPLHAAQTSPPLRAPYQPPLSAHSTVVWPPLPGPATAVKLSLLSQLEQSQWWSPRQLYAQQLRQAGALLLHAYRQVPFYRERLAQAGFLPGKPLTPEVWRRVPVLTRADLQQAGPKLYAAEVPSRHGRIYEISSSGSTGRPVKARGSDIVQTMWQVLTLREHLWHRRDFSGKLAAIRSVPHGVADYPKGMIGKVWGKALRGIFASGPSLLLSIASRTEEQAEWLQRMQPDYLLIYPSALRELLIYCRAQGIVIPGLREVRTLSELLPEATRELCREVWGLEIVDMYSTQENGYLALQCPEQPHFHAQSEVVLLEVLNPAGEPCKVGEVGQVVVTPLWNFAMPMLRYAVGDLAEVGAPCSCGRGLPVLKRILGRTRDMIVYPDGRKAWALIGEFNYTNIPVLQQFQVVQHATDDVEFKVVAERELTQDEQAQLLAWFHERAGHPFPVRFTYQAEIPRSAGGKFQDFRCDIPGA
jgi:phenylacetate-CoA ligase